MDKQTQRLQQQRATEALRDRAGNPTILSAVAECFGSRLHFEMAWQHGRQYYRLVSQHGHTSLLPEHHALEAVRFWREQGWLIDPEDQARALLERLD
jgi:hypothetical protein